MSTEPFIGEVKLFGFNFAPRGYDFCAGQLLAIQSNSALFSLLGTTYGGNGVQTFGLPDLRGRVPIGQGQGPGLPTYTIGEMTGMPTVTLTTANMPAHNHSAAGITVSIPVSTSLGEESSPSGAYLAATSNDFYAPAPTNNTALGHVNVGGMTGVAGSSMPFPIMQPVLAMNYCIATVGIFPSRQ